MIFYIDKECDIEFPFDMDTFAKSVVETALDYLKEAKKSAEFINSFTFLKLPSL